MAQGQGVTLAAPTTTHCISCRQLTGNISHVVLDCSTHSSIHTHPTPMAGTAPSLQSQPVQALAMHSAAAVQYSTARGQKGPSRTVKRPSGAGRTGRTPCCCNGTLLGRAAHHPAECRQAGQAPAQQLHLLMHGQPLPARHTATPQEGKAT